MDGKAILIKGNNDKGQRITSKDFDDKVQEAVKSSNEIILELNGQHNVGGRLNHKSGIVNITVKGHVGQRLGCMGKPGTTITCEGPASDDVGYLNIGADITILGDATNGVCNATAQGRIMINGSIGSRGLTMTKWNPDYERPELWLLGSAGDTFAEFNCGGVGIICGVNPKNKKNILGYRPCVGMVGGWIFYRGETDDSYSRNDVYHTKPDDEQWLWLESNLPEFLKKIGRTDLLQTLTVRGEWKMLVSIPPQEKSLRYSSYMSMEEFRVKIWEPAFKGDPLRDLAPGLDRSPIGLIESGDLRREQPFWENHKSAAPCTYYCPTHIPTMERLRLIRENKVEEAYKLTLEHTPFPASVCGAICPNICMENCSRQRIDESIDIALLGRSVQEVSAPEIKPATGKKVAIIGGGPAGLSAAWQLTREGIETHIFEKDHKLGGKLAQVIPWERLPQAIWNKELDRIINMPNLKINYGVSMTKNKISKLKEKYDYILIAVGAHEPRRIPFPGSENVIPALDFLKSAKSDSPMEVGKQVIVIGAGNAGCDVACEAYRLGAEEVTLVDIQKPLSFGKERDAAEALGAKFRWPVTTKEITKEGLVLSNDEIIPAQTIFISIGDIPALNFLPDTVETNRGMIKTEFPGLTTDEKILAVGDVERTGLATDALGSGKNIAEYIISRFKGKEWVPYNKRVIEQAALTQEHYCPAPQTGITSEDEADRCMSCGSCRDCHLCETICPTTAITRVETMEQGFEYISDDDKCIGCGFCRDTCPCGIWVMQPFE